jgi:hypothetical protein
LAEASISTSCRDEKLRPIYHITSPDYEPHGMSLFGHATNFLDLKTPYVHQKLFPVFYFVFVYMLPALFWESLHMARLAESLALKILGFKARPTYRIRWSFRPLDDLLSDNLHVILFFPL